MDLVRVSARLGIAILVAGLWVAVDPTSAAAQLLSPGPLSRDHAELEGDGSCGRCHATGRGISTQGCVECHDDVGSRVRAGQGLHGREYRGRSCGECHVEHVGARAQLVRWPGGARERFDHAPTGWPLQGGHRGVDCARCHDGRNRRGSPTFLGARTECRSCHEDPHENRFGNDCASCHQVLTWREVRMERFDHGRTDFPLRGRHAEADCARCHHEPPRYRGIPHDRCSDCHQDPHQGRLGANCESCHAETGWDQLAASMRAQHPRLSLENGHQRVDCARCHDRGLDQTPARGSACVDCHRPVHEAPLGRDCARCHQSIRWLGLPHRVGERAHEDVPFRLTGAHVEVECAGCHLPSLPVARRYRQLEFDACRRCHEDRHAGEFASRDQGECGPCHTDTSFRPSRFGPELHATTAFPLTGRHDAVPCMACHTSSERPRTSFRVAPQDCASCHANPHGTQFAAEMAAGGCAQCHDPAGWNRPRIDHGTWPLTGAHQTVACESCHSASEEDRRTGRGASYRGAPRECQGCHADPHAGQFALTSPSRACADCHETSRFAIASFDHAGRTGFALDGRHVEVACASCHQTARVGEQDVTRYRLGYRRCADCHADPHAAAARGGAR
jgi:hypothetical protein